MCISSEVVYKLSVTECRTYEGLLNVLWYFQGPDIGLLQKCLDFFQNFFFLFFMLLCIRKPKPDTIKCKINYNECVFKGSNANMTV